MMRFPHAPRPPRHRSTRQHRGHAFSQRKNGVPIWIAWHVISRFLNAHVTIVQAGGDGQRWRTELMVSALRWSGRGKRSFRRQWLKSHSFTRLVKSEFRR
jgi:hypothetical protein